MNILILDAQGGGIGRALIAALRQAVPAAEITAVGTNSAATAAMLKAGAQCGYRGERGGGRVQDGGRDCGANWNCDRGFSVW